MAYGWGPEEELIRLEDALAEIGNRQRLCMLLEAGEVDPQGVRLSEELEVQ
ncbi:hypothetical protein ACIA8R_29625 [Nonomuraea sp. NPDC051191]|uniref:hypothetical protein n=1 Tax=Nonomuraea sp. NPDC051191 TaxID=3364372 RepID=UPI0037A2793D